MRYGGGHRGGQRALYKSRSLRGIAHVVRPEPALAALFGELNAGRQNDDSATA